MPETESGGAISHVLFDFFGTLVSYSPRWVDRAYPRSFAWLQTAGARLDYPGFLAAFDALTDRFEAEAERSLDEYSMDVLCHAFLQQALPTAPDGAAVAAFRDGFLAEWGTGVLPIPGLNGMLAELAERHTLVLLSNTHHAEMVRTLLAGIGAAPYVRQVVTSVEHGKRKPSPLIFRHALAASGGAPEGAVYVGDSYTADYLGATGAGLRCLLIDPYRRHPLPEEDRLDHVLQAASRIAAGTRPRT